MQKIRNSKYLLAAISSSIICVWFYFIKLVCIRGRNITATSNVRNRKRLVYMISNIGASASKYRRGTAVAQPFARRLTGADYDGDLVLETHANLGGALQLTLRASSALARRTGPDLAAWSGIDRFSLLGFTRWRCEAIDVFPNSATIT
jgi:hypothetical protein